MTTAIRLAVDLQVLQVEGFADRGVGRYVAAHAGALARIDRVARGFLAPDLPPPAGLPRELAHAGLVGWDAISELRAVMAGNERLAHHVAAPFVRCGPLDPSGHVINRHWADAGIPRVVTLYDLIPLRAPHRYLPTPAHVERYRARAAWVGRSDLVLSISEHTRADAIELLGCDPERVVTIGAGVSSFFSPEDGADTELFRFHLPTLVGRPFALTVGGSDVRKGTERLITSIGLLAEAGFDLDLAVIGSLTPQWKTRLFEAARAAGVSDRVVLAGRVSDELLRACYRRAALTVMPSVAEGFGLPVLESAACGTPALASAGTALEEAAATPLATFDPRDAADVARAIAELVADDDRRRTVLDAQRALVSHSTWEAVGQRSADALDLVIGRLDAAAPSASTPHRRVALMGPLPPMSSGPAVYSDRLLRAWPHRIAVDAVTPLLVAPDLPPGVRHFPADAVGLDVRLSSYDAVVYVLGNSDGHLPTVEVALGHPGWLWLHEVRLPAIAVTALEHCDDDHFAESFSWLLERSYPGRAPHAAAERAGRSVLELVADGIGLVPLLVERCRGILVNSEVARRLLVLDLPPLASHPPIHALPPACPPVEPRQVETSPEDPVVVAFGVVSMAKRPDLAVDAAAIAGCRLAFVGPCPPLLAQVIGDRARVRGTAERVEVTGAVDHSSWRHWLERATLALQLREGTSGETSAAVLDALAAGVPVITNLATAGEYPPGTLSYVASGDPHVVGARMQELISSADEQRALAEGGLRFASDHQFHHLAERLVSAVLG